MKRTIALLGAFAIACSTAFGKDMHPASNKFDHSEYMQATSAGQKKAAPAVKGTLSFDTEKKSVDFLDQKGSTAFSIKYDRIKNILYEKTSTPRYAEAVLISPLFVFSHSKKHFLTIQYTDDAGAGQVCDHPPGQEERARSSRHGGGSNGQESRTSRREIIRRRA